MSIVKIKRQFNVNDINTATLASLQEGELGYIGGQYNNLYIGTPDGHKLLNPITEDAFNQLQSKANATNIYYGKCSTAAGTAAKTVTVDSNFILKEGVTVIIYFTNSNTASSPTLNVNSKGAKPIYCYGTTKVGTTTTTTGWIAGAVQMFTYNGTGWVRDYWSNTIYSEFKPSGESAAKGLVPKPSTTAGVTKYLREDATWAELPKLLLNNENNKLQLLQQINDGAQTLLSETNTSVYWANVTDFNTEEQTLTLDKSGADIIAAYQSNCTVGIKGTIDGVNLTLPLVLSVEEIEGDLDSVAMAIFAGFVLVPGSDSPMIAAVGVMGNSSTQGTFSMEPIASGTMLSDHINDTSNPHNVTKSQVGLGSVENKSSATIRSEITKANVTNALGYTPLESGNYAGSESAGGPANSVKSNLKFGSKTYNGSQEQEITAADLNITSPMTYRGPAATLPSNADAGDVYTKDAIEYVWSGTAWVELGDSGSFALKTVEVVAGDGLAGGGALTGNVTLSLENDYAGGTKVTLNGIDKGANVASFYAPEDSGSNNQVLISSGDKSPPEWTDQSSLEVGTAEAFTETAEIKLTGDIEGSASSTHGWEIETVANQAAKWTNAIGVKIQDADKTNSGEEADMDGSDDVTILLPSTIKANLTGNASTASAFSDKADITLKGDVTGSASSTHGWEITTELPNRLKSTQAANEKLNDANEALTSGFHYISGATTNRPAFAQASDHTGNDYRIWATAHSDNWLQQIATDFRCNDIFYRRRDNGTWKSWVQIQTTESADARYAQLAASNTFTNGHIYLGGVASNNSTGNKTQLVFGTNTANHIALSSNDKCLILNPTTGSTANQICLYVNGTTQSVFPKGIAANSSGALPKIGSETKGAANHPVFLDAGTIKAVTLDSTANAMLNSLSTGSSTPEDNDYYISQYVNGGNTTTTYHRRPVSKLYEYMKNKLQNDNVVLGKPIKAYTTLAHNATTNSDRTGYHLIEINSTTNWMLTFTIRLYQGYNYTDVVVSGYNYTGSTKTWHDPKATIIGTHDTQSLNVVFGNSADCKCWVAIPAGNYYGIDIINVTNGHTQIADWTDVFKLSYVASVPTSAKTAVTKTAYAPWYRDETIPVAHGGTGVTTLAQGEAVIGNGAGNVTTRAIVNLTAKGGAGWTGTSSTASNHHLINRNTLSYWDGSYDGTTSNLSKLGTIISGVWQGTVITPAYGGTGTSSQTAKRLVRINDGGTALISSGHYADDSKVAINSTSTPSYNLYVNGTSYLNGKTQIANTLLTKSNIANIQLRDAHNNYDGVISYQTAGNEAVVFSVKHTDTSFIFATGEDTVTNLPASANGNSRWQSLTSPGLQIKHNAVSIGELIANGVAPSYKLKVAGTVGITDKTTITCAHTTKDALSVIGGAKISNTLRIGTTNSNPAIDGDWCEGIRINAADNQWVTIALGATGETSKNTHMWSIHRTNTNDFNISKNSSDGLNGLVMTSIGMGLGIASPTHRLHVVGDIKTEGTLYLERNKGTHAGKINFWKDTYHNWVEYMAPAGDGQCATGGKTIGYGDVTSYARRSIIENISGYGWMWESSSVTTSKATSTTAPNVLMSLSSNTGKLKVKGIIETENDLVAAGRGTFAGLTSTSDNMFVAHGNEFNFIPNDYSGMIYINYQTVSRNSSGAVSSYVFLTGNGSTTSYADLQAKNAIFNGNLTVNGNTVLGDANTDNTTIYGSLYKKGNSTNKGHIYLDGAASASTNNTTQIIFREGTTEHIALSSNDDCFVINPTSTSSSPQIALYLGANATSNIPGGLSLGKQLSVGTNATIGGTLTLTKTQDLSGTANNGPALIIGGAATSTHMEIDCNEIQAKTNGTSVAELYLNSDGGLVTIGSGGLTVGGLITANGGIKGNLTGSSTSCSGNAVGLAQSGYGNGNLTYYQVSSAHAGSEASWASYIICNHGDGSNYYNQTIRMPFWGPPQYSRMEGGVQQNWFEFITDENYTSKLDGRYINASGDSMTGTLTGTRFTAPGISSSWWNGRDNAIYRVSSANGYSAAMSIKSTNGSFEIGHYNASGWHNTLLFNYKDDTSYANGGNSNSVTHAMRLSNAGYLTLASGASFGSNISITGTITSTGNITISNSSRGYYLKDSTGYQYPGVYDNGSNLWLGSTQTAAQHHRGGTYISAGYNGTTGNSTIYVSVPNTTNNGGTNYAVFHAGYVPASLRYGNNPNNVGIAWVKDTNYFLRPANDDTIAESVNLGSTNHPWDNIYCEVLRATVSGKIEAVTTAGIHGQNDLYLTHTSGNYIYFGYGSESSVTVGMKYQQGSGLTLTKGNLITEVGYVNSAGAKIRSQPTYDGTTSYATNTYVGTTGIFSRTTNTSSRTIKHDIDILKDNTLKADNLYNLPVHQFKYNDGILTDEEDARYHALLPGFIIEEMDEVYPIAVDKPVEDVKQWSWNAQYLIPPMLQLIQDQKKQLDKQQAEIDELKELVNKLLEKLS